MADAPDTPGLPIDKAAQALLDVSPALGAVIIFLAAALIAMAWFITRMLKDHREEIAAKDAAIAAVQAEHTADLKLVIPQMHEIKEAVTALRETVLAFLNRGRRT